MRKCRILGTRGVFFGCARKDGPVFRINATKWWADDMESHFSAVADYRSVDRTPWLYDATLAGYAIPF